MADLPYDDGELIQVPLDVARCPYCGVQMDVRVTGWDEMDGRWLVSEVMTEERCEPEMGTSGWHDWLAGHSVMPYVHMLPVEMKIIDWLNDKAYPKIPGVDMPDPNTLNLF